ncbi:MAG: hypothetical protein WCG44_04235 [bacterium]
MFLARKLLHILFSFSLVLYLVLFLIENIFPGFVSHIFSLNYLLYPVLLFGIISSLYPLTEQEQKTMSPVADKFKASDAYLAILLSILGGILIYYKIELEAPLRMIISVLAGLLILLTSLMIVIPEDYKWKFKLPKFNYLYYWIPLFVAVVYLIFNPSIYTKQKEQIIKRLAPNSYNVVIVNQSGKDEYSQTYEKLLRNNGYKNIVVESGLEYPQVPQTTIMYGSEDSVAGTEITEIIKMSYAKAQTAPLGEKAEHKIVIILTSPETE